MGSSAEPRWVDNPHPGHHRVVKHLEVPPDAALKAGRQMITQRQHARRPRLCDRRPAGLSITETAAALALATDGYQNVDVPDFSRAASRTEASSHQPQGDHSLRWWIAMTPIAGSTSIGPKSELAGPAGRARFDGVIQAVKAFGHVRPARVV